MNKAKAKNKELYEKWQADNEAERQNVEKFNREQEEKEKHINNCKSDLSQLKSFQDTIFSDCIDFTKAQQKIDGLPQAEEKKTFQSLPEPNYYSTDELDEKLQQAYRRQSQYENYEENLRKYNEWVEQGKQIRQRVDTAEKKLKEIEQERQQMINNANIPEEFEFKTDGVYYQGFPLQSNQVSSSGKYIAALKLGSMAIGNVRTMYFDASFLDKNSLAKVEQWANENDLQLLIERPDYEGGEIKYELI